MNESTIYKKLNDYFSPSYLKVINDSEKHKSHKQSPKSGNSHFTIEIKSSLLFKLKIVEQHRLIYKVLEEGMRKNIHALSIKIIP